MSVLPVAFNPDNTISVLCHCGYRDDAYQLTEVKYATNMDGSPNHAYLILECISCGSSTTHPASGGDISTAANTQRLFSELSANGCICGAQVTTMSDAEDHVKALGESMDGDAHRWLIEDAK